jgi:hypothetical protein
MSKRILVCSDNKAILDRIHSWFNLSPLGYTVSRADGLERAQYQYRTQGAVRYNLVVVAEFHKDGADEWVDLLTSRGQTILEMKKKIDLTKQLHEKDPLKDKFFARVAELLGT